jgi:hypothetical protein
MVTDPRGPEALVERHEEECRRRLGGRDWRDLVAPVAGPQAARRIEVYAEGFLARLEDALGATYEAVVRVLGPRRQRTLVRRYAAAHPPRHYDLARAGDRLPEHLEVDPLAAELPFLPDLARLERAAAAAFHAEVASPVTAAELAALDPDRLARARLVLQEHVTGLRSAWPVRSLRDLRGVPDEAVSLPVVGCPEDAIVHRAGLDVVVREPEPGELACLEALRVGAPFGEALERALAAGADAAGVQSLFARWTANGLVVSVAT